MYFLKKKLIKSFLFIFIFIFCLVTNSSFAIKGSEISHKLKNWLLDRNIVSNPNFSNNKVFKNCIKKIKFKNVSDDFKLVKAFCPDENGWKIYIKPNISTSNYSKTHKEIKLKKIIVLKKSVEKGKLLTLDDLEVLEKKTNNYFYTNVNDLVGRRLKQNLRKGQIIKPRHLFKRFDINVGDQVVIVSNIGKAYVSSNGIVQKSGIIGDFLSAKNIRSGKIVKGYLKKNKIIQIYR